MSPNKCSDVCATEELHQLKLPPRPAVLATGSGRPQSLARTYLRVKTASRTTQIVKLQIDSPQIVDISKDLANGVALIRLIEALQGRKYYGKIYEDDPTEIQMLLNVQMALDALREDGVKTVNIVLCCPPQRRDFLNFLEYILGEDYSGSCMVLRGTSSRLGQHENRLSNAIGRAPRDLFV
ncbi:hypothetical protein ANCDUO_20171 [Ancylostoma duodenale]|uniref:Calponin-homology (CH) domain-containing protein n=1 Tax=Ancylostoma duodenale TaxID=51022 RepID=A0A0C2C0I3_9BILA|nr:hypothetical protein ANCDUO_20171 [Ancylostoma duodenale]